MLLEQSEVPMPAEDLAEGRHEPPEATGSPSKFSVNHWLRWAGTLTFISAAIGFLIEGYSDTGSLRRELSWTAVTLALTCLGILAVRRLRDAVGARIFLGLAAVTIPVHFAQAGSETRAYFVEGTSSLLALGGTSGLLLLLLPPLALGVAALVRTRGVLLTLLLFVLSFALLIPSRDGNGAAALAMGELLVLAFLELRSFRHDPALQTPEGIAARVLLAAPAFILLARHGFYTPTDGWRAALFAAPSVVVLIAARVAPMNRAAAQLCDLLGLLCIGTSVILLGLDPRLAGLALSLVALSAIFTSLPFVRWFAAASAMVFALTCVIGAIVPATWFAVLVVLVGTTHVIAAYRVRRSLPLVISNTLATLVGLLGHMMGLIRLPTHDVWLLPACFGIGLLLLASVAERHRAQVGRLWGRLSSHFGDAPQ